MCPEISGQTFTLIKGVLCSFIWSDFVRWWYLYLACISCMTCIDTKQQLVSILEFLETGQNSLKASGLCGTKKQNTTIFRTQWYDFEPFSKSEKKLVHHNCYSHGSRIYWLTLGLAAMLVICNPLVDLILQRYLTARIQRIRPLMTLITIISCWVDFSLQWALSNFNPTENEKGTSITRIFENNCRQHI